MSLARKTSSFLALLALLPLVACPDGFLDEKDTATPLVVPSAGTATLQARATTNDYILATLSIEYGTVEDEALVNNDWDLLYGNDNDPKLDEFRVNTVADDTSAIYNLGDLAFAEVPGTVDPTGYPTDSEGLYDNVLVALSHTYYIHTLDSDTEQVGVVRVKEWTINEQVVLDWCRSPEPGSFEATDDCLAL